MSLQNISDIASTRIRYSASNEPSHDLLLSIRTIPRDNMFCEINPLGNPNTMQPYVYSAREKVFFSQNALRCGLVQRPRM